jgi:hypothetical protein
MSADKLQKVLKFTDADLKANRDGYMSKAQRKKLSRYRAGLLFFGIGALITPFAVLGMSLAINDFDMSIGILALFIVTLCLAFFAAYLLFWQWHNSKKDLKKGDIVAVRGKLRQQEMIIAIVDVENNHFETFDIPLEAIEDFETGASYSVYYAPATRQILSVEKLEP